MFLKFEHIQKSKKNIVKFFYAKGIENDDFCGKKLTIIFFLDFWMCSNFKNIEYFAYIYFLNFWMIFLIWNNQQCCQYDRRFVWIILKDLDKKKVSIRKIANFFYSTVYTRLATSSRIFYFSYRSFHYVSVKQFYYIPLMYRLF